MSNPYSNTLRPDQTPQSEPIPGREKEMTENRAGGHVFQLDKWTQLRRFLILGAEGPTYYATKREMVLDNATALQACVKEDPLKVLQVAVEIDSANRAPKRAPLLFALGVLMVRGNAKAKSIIQEQVGGFVRTASDLFQLLSVIRDLKGGGTWWASRSIRTMIRNWYNSKDPESLAYQLCKYRNRHGFTHQDAIRLGHPKPETEEHSALLRWAVQDEAGAPEGDFAAQVRAFEAVQEPDMPEGELQNLIQEHRLTWEMLPSDRLRDPAVWEAMLGHMPYRAMIRNLGRMGSVGLLTSLTEAAVAVASSITDPEAITKSRVHPLNILSALLTYQRGTGFRGSLTWEVVQQVVTALEDALDLSFGNVEPTGKRWYLAVDVSPSMSVGEISGIPGMTPRQAAAVLSLVLARREERYVIRGFADRMYDLDIQAGDTVKSAMAAVQGPWARTNAAAPMVDAASSETPVDLFVVLTDNESWFGNLHPSVALQQYREKMGIPARLAVVAMTSTGYSIADPKDPGMLDMVGFDSAAPEILRQFALGKI